MNINELLLKPVWQMTGEEFLHLHRHASQGEEVKLQPNSEQPKRYVYGILGISRLFGCSLPTANRIKKSGKIDKAITQIGRKIIVDAELALELAGKDTQLLASSPRKLFLEKTEAYNAQVKAAIEQAGQKKT